MAFRGGRGRGRGGRGRGGFMGPVDCKPYILFPENPNLPSVPAYPLDEEEKQVIIYKESFEKFYKESCYYLKEAKSNTEIEWHFDRAKSKSQGRQESLSYCLKLTPSNFAAELIQGSKRFQPDKKKLRLGDDSGKRLDMLEKFEAKHEGDEKEGKVKKGESEDEEDPEDEVEEESSDDGDYNQNIDFDDDDDDLNMAEEPDEDCYDY